MPLGPARCGSFAIPLLAHLQLATSALASQLPLRGLAGTPEFQVTTFILCLTSAISGSPLNDKRVEHFLLRSLADEDSQMFHAQDCCFHLFSSKPLPYRAGQNGRASERTMYQLARKGRNSCRGFPMLQFTARSCYGVQEDYVAYRKNVSLEMRNPQLSLRV